MKKTFLLSLLFALVSTMAIWAQQTPETASNDFTYTTTATATNGKMHFTSAKLYYKAPANTMRFSLKESGAYYKNGKNRLSFDSFELFNSKGEKVSLSAADFSGNYNKPYAYMLDGNNDTYCCGSWSANDEGHDYFEIELATDLGGSFSFSFITENTTMNPKAFRIELQNKETEVIEYTLSINAPEGEKPTITYNGKVVEEGHAFDSKTMDTELFSATEISGYTWSVVVNEETKAVIIVYTQATIVENPKAVANLANRIGGNGTAKKFKFVLDPSLNSRQEVFVIGAEKSKVLIKGTTISAITTGLGWYLNNIAHINIAWNSLNEKTVSGDAYADLSSIPLPTETETHTSDAKYRYYLNTCTFGYSMTSWTWKRWQQEIDWMALHGINMPLQLVGMEEVWRKFLTMEEGGKRKYGYTDAEAKAFVAGPAFIAWWAMNNLEGWGGTAAGSKSGYNNLPGAGGVQDDAWYARQVKLAMQILEAQRALGMQPVLPGWSGMVPTNFAAKSGYATRGNGGNWAGDFVRPLLLNVSNANYAEIAADYYACLKEVMGESQYYSMDPFHEGGGTGTTEDYQALYAAMEAAQPGSQWVIQQWQWNAGQKLSLNAVPAGKLIVLDLFSDGSPAFDGYNGYAPQEAVFCAIPNFGGRSGLMGRLQNVTDNYFKFKGKYASIKGIGTAPEAIEQTPVTYDLIYQLPWMNGQKPNVAEWVDNYAVARYGKDNSVVKEAWSLLRQGPLNYGADGIQGPVEDVWAARPNLDANKASSWGVTLANAGGTYTPARRQMLIDAVYKLIDQEDELELTNGSVYKSNYLYDLVEFGGAVMADYAYDLLLGIKAAKNAEGTSGATYIARRDAFLQLILDMDAFRGTNLNFRLGKWTQEARAAAAEVTGATTATADWYEYNNARTILSTWSSPGTNLTDYSYRSWQGLLKDYYYKRWKYYFDNDCTNDEYKYFEWNWAHGKEHYVGQTGFSNVDLTEEQDGHTSKYTREPEGNTVEEAWNLLNKYIVPITASGKSTYAYRHLENDFISSVTVGVQTGTVDLTQFFGVNLENATLTIEGIANNVTNLKEVNISGAEGTYPATLTLGDKTVINFTIRINSARDQAQQELQELIADMTALINNCGEVTIEQSRQETAYVLQYETASNANYLSSNADQNVVGDKTDGKGISGLTDNNVTTYMHTQWSGTAVGEAHHVQVSNIQNLGKFTFTYATRKGTDAHNTSPAPTIIELYGSTDGENYTELIATFKNADTENPLPSYGELGKYWTSVDLNPTKQYKGLRFKVTKSQGPNNNIYGGQYFFAMSEFALTGVITDYTVEATLDDNAGRVTVEQLATAAKANEFAKELAFNLIPQTEADLQAKKAELQAIYDALLQAYNSTSNPIAEAAAEAKAFLDSTPASVGYPSAAEREKFLAVIEAQESVETIEAAQEAFVATTNVYMPEDGKAYKIRAWWRNKEWAMTFVDVNSNAANCDKPAYAPVEDTQQATTFVCRMIDAEQGTYAFISDNGYYLGWLATGKDNNTSKEFNVFSEQKNNTLKVQKSLANNKGDQILNISDVFGTFNILGINSKDGTNFHHLMFSAESKNYHNDNPTDMYYADEKHTVYYKFEEVTDYTINKPTHTPVIKEQNPLLSGIEDNQTISTFSAPYATVMPEGVTAYYAQQAYNGNTLYLTAMEEGKALPAEQGVILIGSSVDATAIVPATTEELADIDEDNNFFKSSAEGDVTMGENDYILAEGDQGIGIYKAESGTTLKAGKAYLSFENAQQAKSFVMQFGGTPTGIEDLLFGTPNTQDIYDLSGRRVTKVTKGGVYIKNGKKFIVK